MTREIVRTDEAAKPGGPYSQAIKAGSFVFVSSCDGRDPKTLKRPVGVEAQTRQTLTNISVILKKAGTSLDNMVKVSVFLADVNDFESMNKIYAEFFPKGSARPNNGTDNLPRGHTRVDRRDCSSSRSLTRNPFLIQPSCCRHDFRTAPLLLRMYLSGC